VKRKGQKDQGVTGLWKSGKGEGGAGVTTGDLVEYVTPPDRGGMRLENETFPRDQTRDTIKNFKKKQHWNQGVKKKGTETRLFGK